MSTAPRGLVSPSPTQRGLPFPRSTQGGLLFLIAALTARRLKNSPPTLPLLPAPSLLSGSPSAHPQPTICTVWVPVTIGGGAGESLASASRQSLASASSVPDSASACRSSCSTIAPSSLLSAMVSPLVPSSLWLRLGLSSFIRHLGTTARDSSGCSSSLQLRQALPSLRLLLGPLRLRLHRGLLDPLLRIGCLSHLFHCHPPDPPRHPGSSALCLRLLRRLLCCCWSAPWSHQPFLIYGSSLCRLLRGLPLPLWPGSHLAPHAPSPSCLLSGSSVLLHHPGHCLPALPGVHPPSEPPPKVAPVPPSVVSTARGRTFREVGDMSGIYTFFVVFSPMCSPWPSFPLSLRSNLSHLCPVNYPSLSTVFKVLSGPCFLVRCCTSTDGATCVSCLPCFTLWFVY